MKVIHLEAKHCLNLDQQENLTQKQIGLKNNNQIQAQKCKIITSLELINKILLPQKAPSLLASLICLVTIQLLNYLKSQQHSKNKLELQIHRVANNNKNKKQHIKINKIIKRAYSHLAGRKILQICLILVFRNLKRR